MEFLNNFSTREKNLWSELFVDLVVGLYYYPKIIVMVLAGGDAISSAALVGLIIKTVILSIVLACVVAIFLYTQKKSEEVDERDQIFKARGNSIGYSVLVICIVGIMGQVIIHELLPAMMWNITPFDLGGVVIANLLLFSIFLSSLSKTLTQLFFYRRGY